MPSTLRRSLSCGLQDRSRLFVFWAAAVFLISGGSVLAETPPSCSLPKNGAEICISQADFEHDTCTAIEVFASRYRLNPHFFTRLIWQESRFNPNAISPANAQGIAQFIPSTAKIKGLNNPFNPAEALEVSASYLAELITRFGNPGLAAVAYNAGENRARTFRADGGFLPRETWNYVQIITNHTADAWRSQEIITDFHLSPGKSFYQACLDLAKDRSYSEYRAPAPQFKPWGVQVAAGKTRSKARAAFLRRAAACPVNYSKKSVDYISQRYRGSRKRFSAVRIGFDSRGSAARYCAKLRNVGCACAVYRNK